MQPKRVLIIDDDDDIREIAALSFEVAEGWDVHTCASGAEGIQAALAADYDLILLDVMMPELDGPATLRVLRTNPRTSSMPVIFLTAKVQARDTNNYPALGVHGVLAKPFDPLTLPSEVEAILGAVQTPAACP